MQSQQKKVKWSRGETADALEERTDTGITQVSVSRMENIIADIYGNISRRPAFRTVPYENDVEDTTEITPTTRAKMVPFKISADDFVIFLFPQYNAISNKYPYYRVKDGKIVYTGTIRSLDTSVGIPTAYAQNNNFLIIAGQNGTYKIQSTNIGDTEISFSFEPYAFSGAWYAEAQEQSSIDDKVVSGLLFNSNHVGYTTVAVKDLTDNIENNTYSAITTGVKWTPENITALTAAIPAGSILLFPLMGGQMRVEGFIKWVSGEMANKLQFDKVVFDDVYTWESQVPSTGVYAAFSGPGWYSDERKGRISFVIGYYAAGRLVEQAWATVWMKYISSPTPLFLVQNRNSATGFSQLVVWHQHGNTNAYWEDAPISSLDIYVYGQILAPVVDASKADPIVTVLSGYTELNSHNSTPRALTFSNQRLYMGGFKSLQEMTDYGSVVVGSQISKYNDFKNTYGAANEAITIDMATTSRERVFHIVDYNGIQIFTDVAEYSYRDNALLKQSANGINLDCWPAVFKSSLLYVDRSKRYIRVAQYEIKTSVYESSKINALTQEDLVWNPISLSFYEEKEHCTGTFLFVINDPTYKLRQHAELAVCNFLPQNQEVIWTRWDSVSFPYSFTTTNTETTTLRYAWRNQQLGITTYTEHSEPVAGAQLYTADGSAETQFYVNKVEVGGADAISVVQTRNETQQDFYAWTANGFEYYTTSATPSVDDPLYYKAQDGTFGVMTAPENKVWDTNSTQIQVQPDMHYWEGNYSGAGQYFYNKYWSVTNNPQVGDTVYGYDVYPVTHDGTYPAEFTVADASGSTITIKRTNVDTYETITIVATKTPGAEDKSAVWADRDSTADETSTLVTYDVIGLERFPGLDVKHTETTTETHTGESSIICDSVHVDNKVYFLCGMDKTFRLAELDFNALLDFPAPVLENKYTPAGLILAGTTVQVYDGNEYKFNATVGVDGTLSVNTSGLTAPHAGYWINAKLESHPLDIGGKTYTDKKRIGKAVAVIRNTEPNAFTVCGRTGYTSNDKKLVNFYGCTGMKDQIRYTITNIRGAKFTIESLTMIIEYGTLDS